MNEFGAFAGGCLFGAFALWGAFILGDVLRHRRLTKEMTKVGRHMFRYTYWCPKCGNRARSQFALPYMPECEKCGVNMFRDDKEVT